MVALYLQAYSLLQPKQTHTETFAGCVLIKNPNIVSKYMCSGGGIPHSRAVVM